MSTAPLDDKKLFTIDEANAALPLVRAIVKDLSKLSREVIERRQRLQHLSPVRSAPSGTGPSGAGSSGTGSSGTGAGEEDPYASELAQIEEELEKDSRRLQEYVEELRELGVEPKNGPEGLVDFPSLLDGRVVYLCWKLDEPEVTHWHEIDGGFAGRQPLTADSVAGGSAPGVEESF